MPPNPYQAENWAFDNQSKRYDSRAKVVKALGFDPVKDAVAPDYTAQMPFRPRQFQPKVSMADMLPEEGGDITVEEIINAVDTGDSLPTIRADMIARGWGNAPDDLEMYLDIAKRYQAELQRGAQDERDFYASEREREAKWQEGAMKNMQEAIARDPLGGLRGDLTAPKLTTYKGSQSVTGGNDSDTQMVADELATGIMKSLAQRGYSKGFDQNSIKAALTAKMGETANPRLQEAMRRLALLRGF